MDNKNGRKLEYDQKWKGPQKSRSCTDCFCLIIFLAFMCGWAGIGHYAYTYGDLNRLLNATDSEGRMCGVDADVADKPYLFFDLMKCLNQLPSTSVCSSVFDIPRVCVKSCPTNTFSLDIEKNVSNFSTIGNIKMCKIGINENVLKSLQYIEIPTPGSLPNNASQIIHEKISAAINSIEVWMELTKFGIRAYDEFLAVRWTILALLGCGTVLCLLLTLVMCWLATPIVWLSIVGVSGLLGYATYRLYLLYTITCFNYSTLWLVLAIICAVLLGVTLLVSIFLRKRIQLACQLIGEASKAVLDTTSTLFFPVVPWVLQVAVATYALVIGVYVLTLRTQHHTVQLNGACECLQDLGYTNGTICIPEVFNSSCTEEDPFCASSECYLNGTRRPWFSNYMHAYNIFGFLWLIFFISAFGEMVLAGTFATWYWTFKKSDVPFFTLTVSIWRTIRYHVGTLAFGSLLITICHCFRLALSYLDAKLKKYDNALVNFLLKCMKCYFWLLEKFLKFMNKNAYIMCSINGKCFCLSAKSAFSLLMRNIIRVVVIDKITDCLLFMGKLLVTGVVAAGSWWHITTQYPTILYWQIPTILVTMGTYFVASLFFSVYSMAVDTLFLCFLEDSERNDGTLEKPYYMSKSLRNILRKS